MTEWGDEHVELQARNDALREQVDGLLDQYRHTTQKLREAREAAAALSAELTSEDGLVRVSVDATGALSDLHLSATAFDHTRPESLARTILDLVRRGGAQVRQRSADLMSPLSEGLPDLTDLIAGVPSLAGLMPQPPKPPAPSDTDGEQDWQATPYRRPPAPSGHGEHGDERGDEDDGRRDEDESRWEDSDMPQSWMVRGEE